MILYFPQENVHEDNVFSLKNILVAMKNKVNVAQ